MNNGLMPFLRSLKSSLKRSRHQLAFWSGTPSVWRNELQEEENYWDHYLREIKDRSSGRLDPHTELDKDLKNLISEVGPKARLLDVGAGPLTVLAKCWDGQRLDITATDPLAHQYAALIAKYGINPPVRTIYCPGEKLVELFGVSRFDLAFAKNSIDHSYDPLLVVQQMVAVVKPGGFILFGTYPE